MHIQLHFVSFTKIVTCHLINLNQTLMRWSYFYFFYHSERVGQIFKKNSYGFSLSPDLAVMQMLPKQLNNLVSSVISLK